MLFDKLWAQVKGAERRGTLTIDKALDCATRLPQALFCSMMECLAENGEDPQMLVVQVARLHPTYSPVFRRWPRACGYAVEVGSTNAAPQHLLLNVGTMGRSSVAQQF